MSKHFHRGQALVETALALPLVLLTLFTLFWAAKYAIVTERLESDKRFTQHVLDSQYTYADYSLVSLYDAVADKSQIQIACDAPPTSLITGFGAVTEPLSGIQFPRQAMWHTPTAVAGCRPNHQILRAGPYSRDILLAVNQDQLTTQVSPPYASQLLFRSADHTFTLAAQSLDLYQAGVTEDVTKCYPDLYKAVSASLRNGWQPTPELDSNHEFIASSSNINAAPPTDPLPVDPKCEDTPPQGSQPVSVTSPSNPTPPPMPSNPPGPPSTQAPPHTPAPTQAPPESRPTAPGDRHHRPTPPPHSRPTRPPGGGGTPTPAPPPQAPHTKAPPTQAPPTQAPPTKAPPTQAPPTQAPPTQAPPTKAPPTLPPSTPPPSGGGPVGGTNG